MNRTSLLHAWRCRTPSSGAGPVVLRPAAADSCAWRQRRLALRRGGAELVRNLLPPSPQRRKLVFRSRRFRPCITAAAAAAGGCRPRWLRQLWRAPAGRFWRRGALELAQAAAEHRLVELFDNAEGVEAVRLLAGLSLRTETNAPDTIIQLSGQPQVWLRPPGQGRAACPRRRCSPPRTARTARG